eukprot:1969969-Rhodomonas_salina.1
MRSPISAYAGATRSPVLSYSMLLCTGTIEEIKGIGHVSVYFVNGTIQVRYLLRVARYACV